MQTAKDRCPECGKKFFYYDSNSRYWGSPVRTCKKCGNQYLDRRYREIAIEGIPQSDFSVTGKLVLMAVGGFVLYRGIHLIGYRELGMGDHFRMFLPVVFMLLGSGCIIGGIIEIISILNGRKAARYEKMKYESEERLRDRSYAWTLKQEGYNVPEQFL